MGRNSVWNTTQKIKGNCLKNEKIKLRIGKD